MSRHPFRRTASRRRRTAAGLAVTVGSLSLFLAGVTGPATAQEGEGADGPEPEAVEVEKQAYWVSESGAILPDAAVGEFPPETVCIVVPPFCGDQANELTDPVDEERPKKEDTPPSPANPVRPGTLPIGIDGGNERYTSALKFELPEVPEGHTLDTFELHLDQIQPTYHSESPAFRQAVLAAGVFIDKVRVDQQEAFETFFAEFSKALTDREHVSTKPIAVEACPVAESFEGEEAQHADDQPEIDCLFGANGELTDDGTWVFDLTLAAQAWNDGDLANEGVFVRPVKADNLFFGDPDSSTNHRVTFEGAEAEQGEPPAVAMATSEEAEPITFEDTGDDSPSEGDESGGSATLGGDSSQPQSSGGTSRDFSPPVFNESPEEQSAQQDAAPEPEVAADPGGGGDGGEQPLAAAPASSPGPQTPWWVWLLVPTFLAGMYVVAQSLTAGAAVAGAGAGGSARSGAMTRLIEARHNGGTNLAPGSGTGARA